MITTDHIEGLPGLATKARDELLAKHPKTVAEALRIVGVGRKTTRHLLELGLLKDPEGVQDPQQPRTRNPTRPPRARSGRAPQVFYCDESGASGANLVDSNQPFYVAGGFLVPPRAQRSIEALIRRAGRRAGTNELKAAALLKQAGGEVTIDRVLREACQTGAMPFYVVSEKRHNIAQKIVDVLMDPPHNPAAAWLPLHDDARREHVANELLRLPDSVLHQFAGVYRTPHLPGWMEAIERLEVNSRLMGDDQLAKTFRGALAHLADILEAEDYAQKATGASPRRLHFEYSAICLPYFLHVIHLVDGALEAVNATGNVVHDDVPKFERVYREYFQQLKFGNAYSVAWTSGTERRVGVTRLGTLDFRASAASAGVQLADILCGRVRHAMHTTLSEGSSSPPFSAELTPLLSLLWGVSPPFARITASAAFKGLLEQRFARSIG